MNLLPPSSATRPPPTVLAGVTGIRFVGEWSAAADAILTPEAVRFLGELHARFDPARRRLLEERPRFHERIRAGWVPEFPPATADLRARTWKVALPPPDLQDRKVEITGPVERKLMINALNSGASVFMADFEDSHAPTWLGTLEGQLNLRDAVGRKIRFESPEGKRYQLIPRPAVLMVRPRGWHLEETHAWAGESPLSASLFDFGLYFFHNVQELVNRRTGPYFYLPKIEHATEARLWAEVFDYAERSRGLPRGTIRATALIETLPALFEVDEILWELKDHSAGLNCGRWDYIFSVLKQYRDAPDAILPDRAALGMETPFLQAYSRRVVERCHRRGAHALGGMAAQIPIADDPVANRAALDRVRADKEREVRNGHDGTWVAHPGLVELARDVFDGGMVGPNQLATASPTTSITASEILDLPKGAVTAEGVRTNVRVALRYLEAWLRGTGCVPIDHRMEDAATVEIARSQLWQWLHHAVQLADGRTVTRELFRATLREQSDELHDERATAGAWVDPRHRAELLLDEVVTAERFTPFLTVVALPLLDEVSEEARRAPSPAPGRVAAASAASAGEG